MAVETRPILAALALLTAMLVADCISQDSRADGLALVVERASGQVQIVDTDARQVRKEVNGLGDLSHATVAFSHDARHAFVFGRDGGVSKLDLAAGTLVARTIQAGNSIGGALSDDGTLVAVANYAPGGVRVLDANALAPVMEIPAVYGADGARSKVVGLVALPGRRFVFALYDAGEIWLADLSRPEAAVIRKFRDVGRLPYDGNVTPDGRFYLAGLFGEDGLVLLDLEHPERGVRRVLSGYGRGSQPLPVYKMPHLEGWVETGNLLLLPAIGHHAVLAVDTRDWREVREIPVHGQPVFVVARPDGREAWVNFAHPLNDVVEVIDLASLEVVRSLQPGRAVLHIEFSARGEEAWISARDSDRVVVYGSASHARLAEFRSKSPSGIFMAARARRIGG